MENIIKGINLLNDWISGWFQYDFASNPSPEEIIKANDNSIKPSTREAEVNSEGFNNAWTASANENEAAFLMKAVPLGLYKATAEVTVRATDEPLWDGFRIHYLWGENSAWTFAYSAMQSKEHFEGVPGRSISSIPEANHYVSLHLIDI